MRNDCGRESPTRRTRGAESAAGNPGAIFQFLDPGKEEPTAIFTDPSQEDLAPIMIFDGLDVLYRQAASAGVVLYVSMFVACYVFFFVLRSLDLQRPVDRIVTWLRGRGLFVTTDIEREEVWLNLLRFVAGAVAFERAFHIVTYELVLDPTPERAIASIWACVTSAALCIGLFTPFFTLQLFLANELVFDRVLGTYTLGSSAEQILLMFLLFLPAGRRLSIDALLVRSGGWRARVIDGMYGFFGTPTASRTALVKLAAFISYGLLCVYSVHGHFLDPNWIDGTANVYLLTSNWLTGPHHLFRALFDEGQAFAVVISMVLIYVMMLWEFALIPMVLLKGITRYFAIFYGLAFFVVSMFVLQLGKLPHYQFVLWGMLFFPGAWLNRGGVRSLQLLYDDHCNLCDRTVVGLRWLDLFRVVRLAPLSKNSALAAQHGLTMEDILTDLYGVEVSTGALSRGYELYVQLSRRILLLFPLYPVLVLGRAFSIGPAIYGFVARRRVAMFGVCEIPTLKADSTETLGAPPVPSWQRSSFFNAFVATYCLLAVIYTIRLPFFHNVPIVGDLGRELAWVKLAPSAHGQIPIVVFTPQVLQMGTHYFTVTRVMEDGVEKLLPYVGPSGERLRWVLTSDRLYFGHALGWRRAMYGREGERICYEAARDDAYLAQLFRVAEREYQNRPNHYRVDFYHQSMAVLGPAAQYEHAPAEQVCTVSFTGDGWKLLPDSLRLLGASS